MSIADTSSVPTRTRSPLWANPRGVALLVIGAALLWSYWPTLATMARRWSSDPQYSHGYLVPLFALVLLWVRRSRLTVAPPEFHWWGVVFVLVGTVLRMVGSAIYFPWLEAVSLLPCLLGLGVLLGGFSVLRWCWPAVLFLLFMIPLPYRLGSALAPSLQTFATQASTYTLETIGFTAVAEGNIILLEEARIGVVEACSGLSMLIIFFAMSTAVAIVIQRRLWEKLVIVVSAIPIALIANIVRITVTGILHETVNGSVAQTFHDQAAWVMMPLALLLLALELKALSRLFIEVKPSAGKLPLRFRRTQAATAAAARTTQRRPTNTKAKQKSYPLLRNS